jgi:hypothetical protein
MNELKKLSIAEVEKLLNAPLRRMDFEKQVTNILGLKKYDYTERVFVLSEASNYGLLPFEIEYYLETVFQYDMSINKDIATVYGCAVRKALAEVIYGKNYHLLTETQKETVNNFDNVDSAVDYTLNSVASYMHKKDSEQINTYKELKEYLLEYYGTDIKKQPVVDLYHAEGFDLDTSEITDESFVYSTYDSGLGKTVFQLLQKSRTNPITLEEFLDGDNAIIGGDIRDYESYISRLSYVRQVVVIDQTQQCSRSYAVVIDLSQREGNVQKNVYGVAYVFVEDGICYLDVCRYILQFKTKNVVNRIRWTYLVYYFEAVREIIEKRIGFGESLKRSISGYELSDIKDSYTESGLKPSDIIDMNGQFVDYGTTWREFKKNLKNGDKGQGMDIFRAIDKAEKEAKAKK